MNKEYFIIGGGFILEKHLEAIKQLNSKVTFIHNRSDSIGIIDKYFQYTIYLKNLTNHLCHSFNRRNLIPVIITSTDLHYKWLKKFIETGFKEIIVEKPPLSNLRQLKKILKLAKKHNVKIYPILQMRYSKKNNKEFKSLIQENSEITIDYFTPKGLWYHNSWKADKKKSGGILLNTGIHIIDFIINKVKIDKITYKHSGDIHELTFKSKKEIKLNLSILPYLKPRKTAYTNNKEIELEFKHIDFYKTYEAGKAIDLLNDKEIINIYKLIESLK